MVKIVLYKNCILTDTYQNVFSKSMVRIGSYTRSILDHYLNTLESLTYEFDGIYQELEGQLIFDLFTGESSQYDYNTGIYQYNYMRVETYNSEGVMKLRRYCFVNNIKIVNDLVYLDYKEDIWSSYSDKITGINESFLSKARVINYNHNGNVLRLNPFDLVVNYATNNEVKYEPLEMVDGYVNIIVQIQRTIQNQQGEISYRDFDYYILAYGSAGSEILNDEDDIYNATSFTVDDAVDNISRLIQLMPSQTITTSDGTFNYEVGDCYVMPALWEVPYKMIDIHMGKIGNFISFFKIKNSNDLVQISSILLSNNFANKSIGTFTSQIETLNNGTSSTIKVLANKSSVNFSLFMNCYNNLLEITKDFSLNIPISSITSAEGAQQRLARIFEAEQLQRKYELAVEKQSRTGSEIAALGLEAAGTGVGGKGYGIIGSLLRGIGQGIQTVNKGEYIDREAVINKKQYEYDLIKLEAKVYNSNSKVSILNSVALLNALKGIVKFYITPDNKEYVKKVSNNTGFNVYYYISNLEDIYLNSASYFITNNISYNTICFDMVSVYGSFTCEIAKAINNILKAGVKIWYNYQLTEDNYIDLVLGN